MLADHQRDPARAMRAMRAKGDIAAVTTATREAGLRCVLGLICNDGGNDSEAELRRELLARADQFIARWRGDALVHPSLAISVPEVASDEMLVAVSRLCAEAGIIFQSHVDEQLASVERSLVQRGRRPLKLLGDLGALDPQVLIAHGTMVTPHELRILQDTDTAGSYNPVASQWKGNAVAPALQMAELGIRFGLADPMTACGQTSPLMERVFQNLIDNAPRHTPAGGAVCLDIMRRPANLLVSISDTGVGIAKEHLARWVPLRLSTLRGEGEGEGEGEGKGKRRGNSRHRLPMGMAVCVRSRDTGCDAPGAGNPRGGRSFPVKSTR